MPLASTGTSLAKRASKPGRTSGSSRRAPPETSASMAAVNRAGSTRTSTSANERHPGSRVHRVGERHALQDHGPDAAIRQHVAPRRARHARAAGPAPCPGDVVAPSTASWTSVSATAPSRQAWSSRPSSRSLRTRPRNSVNVSSGMLNGSPARGREPVGGDPPYCGLDVHAQRRPTPRSPFHRSTMARAARGAPSWRMRIDGTRPSNSASCTSTVSVSRCRLNVTEQRRPSADNGSRTSTVVASVAANSRWTINAARPCSAIAPIARGGTGQRCRSPLAQAGLQLGPPRAGRPLESDGAGEAAHGSCRGIQLDQLVGEERQPARHQLDGRGALAGATAAADEDGRALIGDGAGVEQERFPLGHDREHRDPGDQRADRDVQADTVGTGCDRPGSR